MIPRLVAASALVCATLCLPVTAQTSETNETTELAAGAATAPAEEAMTVHAGRPDSIVAALHELGFRAKLTEDNQGDPKIESGASGVNFSIYFYGCNDDHTGCRDLLFSTSFNYSDGFDGTPINDWNEGKVIGAAYLDDEGDPGIQHFVAGVYDMSLDSFDRTVSRWEVVLDDFLDFIDW